MTLSTQEITLLSPVRDINGQKGRLYYYQGNFYHPPNIHGKYAGAVKRAIREFNKTHAKLITQDRTSPEYRDLVQLAKLGEPE